MSWRPSFLARKPARPDASTTTPTRTVCSAPSGSAKRSVTPLASKVASSARWRSRTATPDFSAWRRRSSSKVARGTWKVWGVGVSAASAKSAYCSMAPSIVQKLAPHFRTNPAPAIVSWTPRASKISFVQGSWDSPMWKRGNCSRSRRSTRRPRRASAVAVLEPPGPPPMTTASKSQASVGLMRAGAVGLAR